MGKKTKTGKGRLDKYYHLAKEQGYRSRAAFKLVQLNKKYNFLNDARVVIDLCAAPGGWLQVCAKNIPLSSLLIGIDLVPIAPIKGAITFAADITTPKCRKEIQKLVKTWKADVVLHDGAPNMGKSWTFDAYSQADLVLQSLKLATEFLRPGGTFVSKVFRSKDYNALMWVFKQLFRSVEATKPASSRNVSAEIFVVCLDFKAPDKIDPRMLDAKTVFSEVEGKKKLDLFDTKQRRSREGYADGVDGLLYKELSVLAFIESEEPQVLLAEANKLHFSDDEAQLLLRHPATVPEIPLCFQDLRVLGKKEFRMLLKWRETIRAWREKVRGETAAAAAAAGGMEEVVTTEAIELSPEAKLEAELAYFKEKARLREKRGRRAQREELARYRMRLSLNMVNEDAAVETPTEQGLFELKQVRGGDAALATLLQSSDPAALIERSQAASGEFGNGDIYVPVGDGASSDEDDGEGRLVSKLHEGADYDAMVESQLEANYAQYLERKKRHTRRVRIGKREKRPSEFVEVDMDLYETIKRQQENPDGVTVTPNVSAPIDAIAGVASDDSDAEPQGRGAASDSDSEEAASASSASASGPAALLVDYDAPQTAAAAAAEWFDQDLFAGMATDDVAGAELARMTAEQEKRLRGLRFKQQRARAAAAEASASDGGSNSAESMDVVESPGVKRKRGNAGTGSSSGDERPSKLSKQIDGDAAPTKAKSSKGVHIVALEECSSEKSDSESDSRSCRRGSSGSGSDGNAKGGGGGSGSDGDFEVVAKQEEFEDEEDRAEYLALAQQYAKNRRINDLADKSYNRYAFNDRDDLPDWAADEFERFSKPEMPITKAEIEELKALHREINARPIKKVLEAQARKKKVAMARQEALKRKLTALSNDEDIDARSKARAMERAYKVGNKVKKPEKTYVVGKKGGRATKAPGSAKTGRLYKMVDKRMKADVRGRKAADKRNAGRAKHAGGRKSGGGGGGSSGGGGGSSKGRK